VPSWHVVGPLLFLDTYLWPCKVSYPLFQRRHFVVYCHVFVTNQGVPRVKKVAEHCFRKLMDME
jgi:hypothetical protein